MAEVSKEKEPLIFGLDIGTRSIVGTVGYRKRDRFHVVAQRMLEHETRAMLDGQIHDIGKVGATIAEVKEQLEEAVGQPLLDVCIAAAGRVLRTKTVQVQQEFSLEREVTKEEIAALTTLGVEQAHVEFVKENELDMKFYCVGYSVVRYYLNQYPISNLEGHKAKTVGAEMIVTFLPEDVVDGLYKAVDTAGLRVANLTLEPIAAIQVAIPERFRMLNIALVDVGAGTSDISITKDGAIVAYGMIPVAGDCLTELIAKHCLVDFAEAEQIKRAVNEQENITYHDIFGLPQTISAKEILELIGPTLKSMTKQVAECIRQLNGEKPVSAVFVVGGGGKINCYTQMLAEELGLPKERVAIRGEEVMGFVDFEEDVVKDSLLVTPIGICLNFYEHTNNFIVVNFNGQNLKMYDNNKLTVADAAIQAQFPNDGLFPKRGPELNYTVNQKARITRGQTGESAVIFVNGQEADISTPIHANDVIEVKESTAGEAARLELRQLPEFHDSLSVFVNEKKISLPKFASVNGRLQSGFYEIRNRDQIEMLNFYTVSQILAFLDILPEEKNDYYVNNKKADGDTPVYENFSLTWSERVEPEPEETVETEPEPEETVEAEPEPEEMQPEESKEEALEEVSEESGEEPEPEEILTTIQVTVNGEPVVLSGKKDYIYVDVFEYIDFDLSKPQGSGVETDLNGAPSEYVHLLKDGDVLDIYWRK